MRYLSMHHEDVRAKGRDMTYQTVGSAIRGVLGAWRRRSQQRRVLAHLDDRMLRDIGITRSEVAHEVNKTFWQR